MRVSLASGWGYDWLIAALLALSRLWSDLLCVIEGWTQVLLPTATERVSATGSPQSQKRWVICEVNFHCSEKCLYGDSAYTYEEYNAFTHQNKVAHSYRRYLYFWWGELINKRGMRAKGGKAASPLKGGEKTMFAFQWKTSTYRKCPTAWHVFSYSR